MFISSLQLTNLTEPLNSNLLQDKIKMARLK